MKVAPDALARCSEAAVAYLLGTTASLPPPSAPPPPANAEAAPQPTGDGVTPSTPPRHAGQCGGLTLPAEKKALKALPLRAARRRRGTKPAALSAVQRLVGGSLRALMASAPDAATAMEACAAALRCLDDNATGAFGERVAAAYGVQTAAALFLRCGAKFAYDGGWPFVLDGVKTDVTLLLRLECQLVSLPSFAMRARDE